MTFKTSLPLREILKTAPTPQQKHYRTPDETLGRSAAPARGRALRGDRRLQHQALDDLVLVQLRLRGGLRGPPTAPGLVSGGARSSERI